MLFNNFSKCRYTPWLRRYSPTKLCDGAQMAIFLRNFCILYFQRAALSTFQICTLNWHYIHIMCGSMVDIQYPTAENRRGKKEETTAAKYNGLPYWTAIINPRRKPIGRIEHSGVERNFCCLKARSHHTTEVNWTELKSQFRPVVFCRGHACQCALAAWLSGSALVSINEVTLRRARLVL